MVALQEWKRGWSIVAAGAVGMGTGVGLFTMVNGLFILPLEAEFGWLRSDIALAGILGLFAAFWLPVLGSFVDRYRGAWLASGGLVLLAMGYLGLAMQTGELWLFYLLMFYLALVGLATGPLIFTRVVNGWFLQSRGLALGVTLSGVTISSMCMLPLLAYLIETLGWRWALVCLACAPLFIGAPLVASALKEVAIDISDPLKVEGHEVVSNGSDQQGAVALHNPRFWLLAGGLFVANLAVGGFLSQLQPLLQNHGYSAGGAATLGMVFAAGIAIGRLSSGILLDRFWPAGVASSYMLCPLLGIAQLLFGQSPDLWQGAFAVFFLGLAQGAEVDFLAFLVPKYFGMKHYGKLFALLSVVVTVALALGGYCFGLIYDQHGTYLFALKSAAAAYLAGAILLLFSGFEFFGFSESQGPSREYQTSQSPPS